jgi:hypothetical protein
VVRLSLEVEVSEDTAALIAGKSPSSVMFVGNILRTVLVLLTIVGYTPEKNRSSVKRVTAGFHRLEL